MKKYYVRPYIKECYFDLIEILSASSNGEIKDCWELPEEEGEENVY